MKESDIEIEARFASERRVIWLKSALWAVAITAGSLWVGVLAFVAWRLV